MSFNHYYTRAEITLDALSASRDVYAFKDFKAQQLNSAAILGRKRESVMVRLRALSPAELALVPGRMTQHIQALINMPSASPDYTPIGGWGVFMATQIEDAQMEKEAAEELLQY
jgi:hypothetical protein